MKFSLLDKAFIKYCLEKGKDVDGVAAQLQLAIIQGNKDYVEGLLKRFGIKDKSLMKLANAFIKIKKQIGASLKVEISEEEITKLLNERRKKIDFLEYLLSLKMKHDNSEPLSGEDNNILKTFGLLVKRKTQPKEEPKIELYKPIEFKGSEKGTYLSVKLHQEIENLVKKITEKYYAESRIFLKEMYDKFLPKQFEPINEPNWVYEDGKGMTRILTNKSIISIFNKLVLIGTFKRYVKLLKMLSKGLEDAPNRVLLINGAIYNYLLKKYPEYESLVCKALLISFPVECFSPIIRNKVLHSSQGIKREHEIDVKRIIDDKQYWVK